jgi:hypothetical protein
LFHEVLGRAPVGGVVGLGEVPLALLPLEDRVFDRVGDPPRLAAYGRFSIT